jgi:RimJ/RimL family protein N-acetyltransferase
MDVEELSFCEWYVIVVDGEDVGTIWLERSGQQDAVATLGVFIGRRGRLGIGIGRQVIPLAIQRARKALEFETVQLHVRTANVRAIACYEKCGFEVVDQGSKVGAEGEEIDYLKMQLCLSPP